jgi:hypothetical protein
MTAPLIRAAFVGLVLACAATAVHAEDKLSVKISRHVIKTQEGITVRAIIPPNADNRMLGIQVDSGEYLRGSEIELDGENAPRVIEVPVQNLPAGEYVVVAVLLDNQGHRTTVRQNLTVMDMPGNR